MEENDLNNFQILTLEQLNSLPRKFKKNKRITIDLTGKYVTKGTKYDLMRIISQQFDWHIHEKGDFKYWNIKWYDFYIQEDDVRKLLPYQKINHFPGSHCLGKKNNLGKYLHKLQKIYPNDYNFFPKTWLLPFQIEDLRSYFMNKSIDKNQKFFIAKPDASCQGRGIFLFNKLEAIEEQQHMIVQQYLTNPYLIDGLKFDCRLYILIKSLDPLKIFLYKDGLARFATVPFKKPKVKILLQEKKLRQSFYAFNKLCDKQEKCKFLIKLFRKQQRKGTQKIFIIGSRSFKIKRMRYQYFDEKNQISYSENSSHSSTYNGSFIQNKQTQR